MFLRINSGQFYDSGTTSLQLSGTRWSINDLDTVRATEVH